MERTAKHHDSAKLIVALTVATILGGIPALVVAAIVASTFAS